MTQLADGLFLDLPNPFAGQIELLTNLFQRHGVFAVVIFGSGWNFLLCCNAMR